MNDDAKRVTTAKRKSPASASVDGTGPLVRIGAGQAKSARATSHNEDPHLEESRRLVRRRWFDLLRAGTLGAAIVVVAAPWLRPLLVKVAPWQFAFGLLAVAVTLVPNARGRWCAFFGLKHFFRYPPLWVAGVFGAALIVAASSLARVFAVAVGIPMLGLWGALASAVVLVGVVAIASSSKYLVPAQSVVRALSPSPREDPEGTGTEFRGSFERLQNWFNNDRPVVRLDDDAFDHRKIAHRIAERLLSSDPPAQAVVGELGAGKTTLSKFVEEILEAVPKRPVRFVRVELWPFDTARAAVQGVLRALVDSLASDVSIVALRGLPSEYAEIMTALGGPWSALARIQRAPANPIDLLKRIDDIATAVGRRYVVWAEDLERFAGAGGGGRMESAEDAERLNPVRAALYGLDQLRSVTVIVATTSLHISLDIEKIARYVEEIPRLPEVPVREILQTFRRHCLDSYEFIDAVEPTARASFDGPQDESDLFRLWFPYGTHRPIDELTALCRTPRTLKSVLRTTQESWDLLFGEVDVDDLLMVGAVREGYRDAFVAMSDHIAALRNPPHTTGGDDTSQHAWAAWDEARVDLLKRGGTAAEAATALISRMFGVEHAQSHPQGVAHEVPRDYWRRVLAVPELSADERDQPVLGAVENREVDALLDFLESGQAAAVEAFAVPRAGGILAPLLEGLAGRRAQEEPENWPNSEPVGLVPLWRIWLEHTRRNVVPVNAAYDPVKVSIEKAIGRNLTLVRELEHFFSATPRDRIVELLDEEHRAALRDEVARLFAREYTSKPNELAAALAPTDPHTLIWLCWGLERVRQGNTRAKPFKHWDALADTLLKAAEKDPRAVLPQLAPLVTETENVMGDRNIETRAHFDDDRAQALFGSVPRVLAHFADQDAMQWQGSPAVRAAVFAALGTEAPTSDESNNGT